VKYFMFGYIYLLERREQQHQVCMLHQVSPILVNDKMGDQYLMISQISIGTQTLSHMLID